METSLGLCFVSSGCLSWWSATPPDQTTTLVDDHLGVRIEDRLFQVLQVIIIQRFPRHSGPSRARSHTPAPPKEVCLPRTVSSTSCSGWLHTEHSLTLSSRSNSAFATLPNQELGGVLQRWYPDLQLEEAPLAA
jgi:hypothetical protein